MPVAEYSHEIFLINLQQSTEWSVAMERRLNDLRLNWERLEAIECRALGSQDLAEVETAVQVRCGAPFLSFDRLLRYMERVMVGQERPAGVPHAMWVPSVHVPDPWLRRTFDLLGCDPRADSLVTAA